VPNEEDVRTAIVWPRCGNGCQIGQRSHPSADQRPIEICLLSAWSTRVDASCLMFHTVTALTNLWSRPGYDFPTLEEETVT
jgi:hypothetical protein